MGVYTNRFRVEVTDVVRIIFSDERVVEKEGVPAPSVVVGDLVMTRSNAQEFKDLLTQLLTEPTLQ